jgi:hypothetical protein
MIACNVIYDWPWPFAFWCPGLLRCPPHVRPSLMSPHSYLIIFGCMHHHIVILTQTYCIVSEWHRRMIGSYIVRRNIKLYKILCVYTDSRTTRCMVRFFFLIYQYPDGKPRTSSLLKEMCCNLPFFWSYTCVCVCVCEREREYACACVYVCTCHGVKKNIC